MKNKLFLIFLLLIYFTWLLPGVKVANDLHYVFPEELTSMFSLPSTWGTSGGVGLGEYAVFVLWFWPVSFIFGLLGTLGIKFSQLIVLAGFLPFLFLGFWGTNKLLAYLGVTGWGKTIGSLFYLINTYILLLIDGGQINLALAYSLLPLSFVLYREAIDDGAWKARLKFALSALALSIFDIRIVYLLALLIGVDFLFELAFKKQNYYLKLITSYLSTAFVVGAVLLGFHAYWLLPAFFAKAPSLPTTYDRPQQVDFLSFANVGHALYLLQPHWFKNVFGKVTPLRWEFVLIPFLVFLAPILKPKNRWVAYWLIVALGSVFLTKGALEPLPGIYPWLFANVPGFSVFRDPTKFFFLTALSYSVLLGITVSWFAKRWRVFPLLLLVYLLFLVRPVYLGEMTGTFAAPAHQEQYFSLAEELRKDDTFGRIFWIPTKQPLGYSSPTHPSVEASRALSKRPFAIGTVGTYEVFNFLREAPFMGEIFDIAGIEYIAYPFPDERREELKQDNLAYYDTFLSQLSSLPWTNLQEDFLSKIPILKTASHQERFFVSQGTVFVVGSDDIYNQMVESGFRLANNALVYVEEQPGLLFRINDFPTAKILLNNKSGIDLAASLLPTDKFVFPASVLDFDPVNFGWWKRESSDFIAWRAFLQNKYGIDNLDFDFRGGWAVAEEGSEELVLPKVPGKSRDILLVRVMESSRSGLLEFFQEGQLVGRVNTRNDKLGKTKVKLTGNEENPDQTFLYDKAEFRWHKVGELRNSEDLTIKAVDGDINVVNMLAVVSKTEWESLQHEASELLKDRSMGLDNLPEKKGEVEVSYEMISPTHYKVSVSGLSGPSTLAFSENYDSLWQVNDGSGVPLYSLINGFSIPGDGEYEVKFVAQQYVKPGLVISGATLLLAILGLLLL